jgi:hypothetical protein
MYFKKNLLSLSVAAGLSLVLTACGGDDGKNGSNGTNGTNGANGTNGSNGVKSLINQTLLAAGNTQCFKGGIQIESAAPGLASPSSPRPALR